MRQELVEMLEKESIDGRYYDEYIAFVIIGDRFPISERLRESAAEWGMDGVYEICIDIAKDFHKYDAEHLNIPQYTALEQWLAEHTDELIARYFDTEE